MPNKTLAHLTKVEAQFTAWLKSNHTGKANPVIARSMRQWGTGPQIRKLVHQLRVKGVPICSTNRGYFYAKTDVEVETAVKFLTSYMNEISVARQGLLYSYVNVHDRLQPV